MSVTTHPQIEKIVDGLPGYVALLDRGIRILWANTAFVKDFGPVDGRTCREVFGRAESKCGDCAAVKTLEDGLTHREELTAVRADGSRVDLLIHTSPLRADTGEIDGLIQMGVNITSVKEIQKQMILLGQTVAGMAHSIKNIMMGLEGGIYVVNKGLEDKKQEEVKEGWEMVLLNFDKISHIVKDILYCSKEREPDFQRIKPNRIVHDIYDLYRETAAKYGIKIELDLDERIEEAVLDPSGLHTVLANLVSNAMDACKIDLWKDSHLVEIRTRLGEGRSLVVEVADNGIGIDKDTKTHVFEDFFSSKAGEGTGLGLMVTQKIVREHEGTITFRSRPGHGTTFVAKFPPGDPSAAGLSDT
ncbi:MAG: ATP-binding protein [Thermodesulfobacteriota bacterium]